MYQNNLTVTYINRCILFVVDQRMDRQTYGQMYLSNRVKEMEL